MKDEDIKKRILAIEKELLEIHSLGYFEPKAILLINEKHKLQEKCNHSDCTKIDSLTLLCSNCHKIIYL